MILIKGCKSERCLLDNLEFSSNSVAVTALLSCINELIPVKDAETEFNKWFFGFSDQKAKSIVALF